MDPIVVGTLGIIFLLLIITIGVHIGIALGVTGFLGLILIIGFEPAILMTTNSIYFTNASYALVTLPLFILMGYLGAGGGISKTLYDGLSVWVGKIRGSLGIATVLGCAGFGAVCGSSIVTAAVFAQVSAPEMRRHGYNRKIAYGLCAAAGSIGMLIPPSLLAVIYGIISGLSVGKLLIAGIGPGLLLTVLFSLQIYMTARFKPRMIATSTTQEVSWRDRIAVLPSFWPVVVTALIIFGGIFGGIFSPTEAAAVATVVILFLLVVTKGRHSLQLLRGSLVDTASTSAMVFLTLAGACVFSRYLVMTGISEKIVETIIDCHMSNFLTLLVLGGLYVLMGSLMDSISMLVITIPILHPVITSIGIDPYHFALIVITATQVGIITPPFGLAVFTVKGVAEPDTSIEDIFRGSMTYFFLMLASLLLIIAFPVLVTSLIT